MSQTSRKFWTAGLSIAVIALLTFGIVWKYANVDTRPKKDATESTTAPPNQQGQTSSVSKEKLKKKRESASSKKWIGPDGIKKAGKVEPPDVLNRRGPAEQPKMNPLSPPRDEDLERQKDQIQAAVLEMRPRVKACYDDMLKEFPDAGGRVVLGFEIKSDEDGEEGRVEMSELDLDKTTLFDQKMNDCMLVTIADLTIDPPIGGGTMKVTYPFVFSNDQDDKEKEEE